MFKLLTDLPPGIVGFESNGKITAADYETVLIPRLEEALKNGPVKLLFVMPEGFHGMEFGAMRDDAVFGIKHYFDFKKFAFVTDDGTMAALAHTFAFMIPAETRVFNLSARDEAVRWLQG